MSDNPLQFTEKAESAQLILQNVSLLSELSFQLKKETKNSEDYINSINNLVSQAGKDVSSLHQCVDSLLTVAKKLVHLSLQVISINDPNFSCLKAEADKLLNILKEIKHDEEEEHLLDVKWRQLDKSLKGHLISQSPTTDEKYPDHCSKESLLDISNITALPTVPEDAFADFHRSRRTLSSTSIKNLRKVKMFLQKVSDLDDDEIVKQEGTADAPLKLCGKVDCMCPLKDASLGCPLEDSVNPAQPQDDNGEESNRDKPT